MKLGDQGGTLLLFQMKMCLTVLINLVQPPIVLSNNNKIAEEK